MKDRIKKLLPSKRKWMQLYFALLFNINVKGFVTGNIYRGNTKSACVPGINCYSCPGAVGACPLGSFQGSFSADKSTLYYVGGVLLLYCMLFGRMICGWLCPFGFIQELFYKIKTPKLKKNLVTWVLSCVKYVILAVFVFLIPIIYALKDTPLPAFCKYICPAGTFEGGLGLLANKVNDSYFSMLGPLFTWKFMLMVSIMVGSIFVFRLFCRFLCPLGALYGLFNKISIFGIKVEKKSCVDCGLCISHCKLDVQQVGDQECISCGECIDVCPTKAIQWKGSNIFLKKNDIPRKSNKKVRAVTRCISLILMLSILIGAGVYYWNEANETPLPPAGNAVGDLCYGYDLQIIDKSGILENTINPVATGKITVVNFWGTWCTPCVNELPYFDRIATEYADTVTVIAIHTHMVIDTAPTYIGKYYPDSKMIFAKDYPVDDVGLNGGYYTALGGRGAYPLTVILDENGIIQYNQPGSMKYIDLKTIIESLLN